MLKFANNQCISCQTWARFFFLQLSVDRQIPSKPLRNFSPGIASRHEVIDILNLKMSARAKPVMNYVNWHAWVSNFSGAMCVQRAMTTWWCVISTFGSSTKPTSLVDLVTSRVNFGVVGFFFGDGLWGYSGLCLHRNQTLLNTYLDTVTVAVPVRDSNRRDVSCVLESNDTCVVCSSGVP